MYAIKTNIQEIYPQFKVYALAFVLGFPIFVTPSLEIFAGNSLPGNFALPLSVLVMPIFIAAEWRGLYTNYLRFFSGVFLLFALLGLVVYFSPSYTGWEMFLVYVLPGIAGLAVGTGLRARVDQWVHDLFSGTLIFAAIHALLFLASSISEFGVLKALQVRGGDSVFSWFSIYQKYNYYPVLLAYAYYFGCIYCRRPWLVFVGGGVIFCTIFTVASREGILIFVLLTGAVSLLSLASSPGTTIVCRVLLFLVVGLIAAMFLPPVKEFILQKGIMGGVKIIELQAATNPDALTAGRLGIAEAASTKLLTIASESSFIGVLFGSAFSMSSDYFGGAHNQYLEWLLRGGVVFLLANLALIVLSLRNAFVFETRTGSALIVFFIVILAVSSWINTPFRVPLTAVFLWLVVGYAYASPNKTGRTTSALVGVTR